jgi:glycosyltransferase involved in cell wall biosynthesis
MKTAQNQSLSIVYPHNQRLMSGKAHDIVIMRTCHAIAKQGHAVKLITGKPARPDTVYDFYGLRPLPEFEILQVPMLRGRTFSWHGVFNLFCLLKILELKKRGQADVIYLREVKLARFLLKFKQLIGLPFVIEVHDLKIRRFYDACPEKDRSEDAVFRKVDAIIVLLNSFGTILKEVYGISRTPVVKVPLAAEKKPFLYGANKSAQRTIGYIGQLYPMQGVDLLIKAIPYLRDTRLSIIGGNEKDLGRLKDLAAHLNVERRIAFHGFVNPRKVMEMAKDIDVMVICALDRGKRRYSAHTKLYEYMAMGKPIVAVDLPSIREEVSDGKDVLLVNPEDPKRLAEKIGYVLENPEVARQLAVNAYRSADEFSYERRALRLSEVFAEVYANSTKKQ